MWYTQSDLGDIKLEDRYSVRDIHRLSALGTPIPPTPHPYCWHNQVHIYLVALSQITQWSFFNLQLISCLLPNPRGTMWETGVAGEEGPGPEQAAKGVDLTAALRTVGM